MMNDVICFKRKGDEILKVYQDDTPESPREWDNLGKIEMYHRHYLFPHEGGFKDDQEGLEEYLESKDIAMYLPIYMYEHSGITIKTSSFNDRWDSGQVGWIYATKEDVRKCWDKKRISKKMLEKVKGILECEVSVYDQHLRGEIYGYTLSKISYCDHGDEHEEVLDSCWGFYELDHILDYVEPEWVEIDWSYDK